MEDLSCQKEGILKFEKDDISTSRQVPYRLEGDYPKWAVHRPGTYAKGFEHLADEVMTVERVVFHFVMEAGRWALREITLSLASGDGPDRRIYHERLTDQRTEKLPFWLVQLTATAAQEA
jgi:hypothetical protein